MTEKFDKLLDKLVLNAYRIIEVTVSRTGRVADPHLRKKDFKDEEAEEVIGYLRADDKRRVIKAVGYDLLKSGLRIK